MNLVEQAKSIADDLRALTLVKESDNDALAYRARTLEVEDLFNLDRAVLALADRIDGGVVE